ncbi:hypothetical protein Cni_G28510 [Canna indica]|uniref:Uncharacterized protein n=1 Tax=Canna indica TaxID=4628 RepID=A0AAQ3QSF6_9LILI|nr:hypothetical protein Cni_G28510 [Canna indica]
MNCGRLSSLVGGDDSSVINTLSWKWTKAGVFSTISFYWLLNFHSMGDEAHDAAHSVDIVRADDDDVILIPSRGAYIVLASDIAVDEGSGCAEVAEDGLAKLVVAPTSSSLVTSQWMKEAAAPRSLKTALPSSSWTSAMTTLARWWQKNRDMKPEVYFLMINTKCGLINTKCGLGADCD